MPPSRRNLPDSRPYYCRAHGLARSPSPRSSRAPGLLSSDLDDLGVTFGPEGGTLRVWSGSADAVELVVFDDTDLDWITDTIPLAAGRRRTSGAITTPLLRPGTRYAIRVDGPHGTGQHRSTAAPSWSSRTPRAGQRRLRGLALRRRRRRHSTGAASRKPARPAGSHGHLRGPSQGHVEAASARAARAARHVCRASRTPR